MCFRLKKDHLLRNLNRERELARIAWILCVYVHVHVWYVSVECLVCVYGVVWWCVWCGVVCVSSVCFCVHGRRNIQSHGCLLYTFRVPSGNHVGLLACQALDYYFLFVSLICQHLANRTLDS